ncbi:hypothetical protein V8E51_002495, partial [Hyaloscypha variabilis]
MATDATGPPIQTKIRQRPKPNGPAEEERGRQRLDLNVKLFSSAAIYGAIEVNLSPILLEVHLGPTGYIPRELPVPFPNRTKNPASIVLPSLFLENNALSVALRRYSYSSQMWNVMGGDKQLEQLGQSRFMHHGVGIECLLVGMDSSDSKAVFKYMVQHPASDYLDILCLEESNDFFMRDRPDTHFEIKDLARLDPFADPEGLRIYSQGLKFPFTSDCPVTEFFF